MSFVGRLVRGIAASALFALGLQALPASAQTPAPPTPAPNLPAQPVVPVQTAPAASADGKGGDVAPPRNAHAKKSGSAKANGKHGAKSTRK